MIVSTHIYPKPTEDLTQGFLHARQAHRRGRICSSPVFMFLKQGFTKLPRMVLISCYSPDWLWAQGSPISPSFPTLRMWISRSPRGWLFLYQLSYRWMSTTSGPFKNKPWRLVRQISSSSLYCSFEGPKFSSRHIECVTHKSL